MSEPLLAGRIAGLLRDVPDFPTPGILFKDIGPLLADADALAATVAGLAGFADGPVDAVCGVEARGFLLAGGLAAQLGCGMVPVRKAGKLPPPVLSRRYALEYGSDEIQMARDAVAGRRVYLVDDVLATGGTLRAAIELLREAGAVVATVGVIVEIGALGGRDALRDLVPVESLLTV